MKFKLIILLVVTALLSSCTQRKKIEIYLTKEQILNYDAIPAIESDTCLKRFKLWSNISEENIIEKLKDIQWDTVRNRRVMRGDFPITINDLEEFPVVYDDEIGMFNLETGEIEIADEGLNRICENLKKKYIWEGQQYVITFEGIPVFKGYLISGWGIGCIGWYFTYHFHSNYEKGDYGFFTSFQINRDEKRVGYPVNIPELNKQHALIEAFRATNRLIE